MKIYKNTTVLEEAIKRINYLFDEFDEIIVSMSGGKDSTVIFELTYAIAKERNRLPLGVFFIDQEAEWQATIDYVDGIMQMPDIQPYWFQMPIVITNNASTKERFSYCWKENAPEEWLRPKSPLAITENKYNCIRFHDLFKAITDVEWKNKPVAMVGGLRADENPKRFVAMTHGLTYKDVTWGKRLNDEMCHYTFYPIYDWYHTDVWKYIHDHGIKYNRIYDEYYKLGIPVREMRVSNLHHETAVRSLKIIQELEPQIWNKLSAKIDGANTIKHINKDSYASPKKLPFMFDTWGQYAKHLAENLIPDPKNYKRMQAIFKKWDPFYDSPLIQEAYNKAIINTILSADWDFTKFENWQKSPNVDTYNRMKYNPENLNDKRKWIYPMLQSNKFLTDDERLKVKKMFSI